MQQRKRVILCGTVFVAIGTIVGFVCGAAVMQESKPGGQVPRAFERAVTKTVASKYWLYLPDDYARDSSKKWPLMLFLHGAGERGDDLERVKIHGPPSLVAKGRKFPFIIVSPQCPANEVWSADVLIALVDEVASTHAVDQDQIYCTGLSMGGYGTWNLGTMYPNRFAAIAPICGGGEFLRAAKLKDVPVWAFHGAKDPVVPLSESERMVKAVKAAGGDARLTVYPEATHDAWTATYANPEFYAWLLAQKRGVRPSSNPS